ncbi:MAG: amino acid adenylation domain-containing protein [Candidatus Aminicenantes bacterium]|jgi:amino acid adenylation domain-containing protein
MKSNNVNRSLDLTVVLSQHIKEKNYWLNKLAGEWEKSSFPVSFWKKEVIREGMKSVTFRHTGELFEKLMKLRNGSDSRLFMILTAGLSALLFKYTHSRDIVLGTPVLRQNIEAEFINTALALRNQITTNMTFKELLLQVKQTVVEATEHQNYPVEQLPDLLNLPFPKESDFPLFDIAVLLENIHEKSYLRHIPLNMIFSFSRTPDCIEGTIQYNPALYEKGTIEGIRDHFNLLFHKVLADINIRMREIDILGEDEKKQLLLDFNDTQKDCPGDVFIHSLIEDQVEKTPDSTALIFDDERLTYRVLDKRANQLARTLKEEGTAPGIVVGIISTPSMTMAVGILGILKAGGAYLPIDPNYPGQRVAVILSDSSAPILVKSVKYEPINSASTIIDLNDPAIYGGNPVTAAIPAHPAHPAYVIYTSGTTGQPKGVLVEHQQAANMLMYRKAEYKMDEQTVSLQLFSYAFDGFVTSFFTPVISGAKVVLLSNEALLDLEKVKQAIRRHKITHFISVPSLFQAILETAGEKDLAPLAVVTLAGEQLLPKIVEMAKQKHKHLEIVHEYGVTEAAVMSTLYRHQEQNRQITIGSPIWNTQVYILNNEMKLQPIGVPGELCIAGAGAARGYLNQPQLTAEKFILAHSSWLIADRAAKDKMDESPMSYQLSAISYIYKTGDLARWLPGGNIEFLGRIDNQVKIWGFRIEPGEIENRLLEHDDIIQTVVIPRETITGNSDNTRNNEKRGQFLCAYFVSKTKVPAEELRDFLLKRLPDYMIPGFFVQVEKIPLTENGKINRKALPTPTIRDADETLIPPGDEVEKSVADIWSDVLGMKKEFISIDKNFFEYGGYSIKATQVINKIHKNMNVKIPLAKMFEKPTIRGLAEAVKKTAADRFIPLAPIEKRDYYPSSSSQKRLFILQKLDLKGISYNAPIVVELEGQLDRKKFAASLKQLIHRHESLRTSFHMIDEFPVQRIQDDAAFEIEYDEAANPGADAPDTPGKAASSIRERISSFIRPFDLSRPPLLRVGLVKLLHTPSARRGHPSQERIDNKHLLIVDMHHIISDGTSLALLVKEFMMLYSGKQLAELKIQYKDYTQWQSHEKQRAEIKNQEAFWLKEFEGEPPVLNLPMDNARPPEQSFEGAVAGFAVTPEDTARIRTLISRENTTLFVVMLALYNVFLSKLSGQEDIVVGTGLEGRRHEDLQQIIGMFVNTLPLRNFPRKDKPFSTFVNEVKEKTLKAFESQEYQFEDLVETLVVKRDKSRNPLFDVMFQVGNLESLGTSRLQMSGLKTKPFPYQGKVSKFDLTLTAAEKAEMMFFTFEYCTKLFKPKTIEIYIRYFKEILSAALENPQQELSKIRQISKRNKQEILEQLSRDLENEKQRVAADPRGQVLRHRLKKSPEKVKDKVAIEQGPRALTFAELHKRSGEIARLLNNKRIKTGTFIGVLTGDRIELILAMLAILEVGAVFVPLDASYPLDRLELMVDTADIEFILTDRPNFDSIASSHVLKQNQVELAFIAHGPSSISQEEKDGSRVRSPHLEYHPEDKVYIYFTSGSTGTPKALLGKNSSLVHFIDWEIDTFHIDSNFRFSQLSAPGFDAFLRDTLVPLCCGGTICIPETREIILKPEHFLRWLERSQVHLVSCVPSLFRVLTANPLNRDNLPHLNVILFSGEKITASDLETWIDIFAERISLVNLWGTSETTLAKTFHFIRKSDLERERLPVGKPIRGAGVIVLDENLEPVDKLVSGELYIRTPYRTFGYYNDPGLNQHRFIKNPFGRDSHDLLHRTGDFGRILTDGTIELLGRNDRQIKIRGIRVELEEIESVIMKHPLVKEAVVIKKELSPRDELLCAYFTGKEKHEPAEGELIDILRNYLSGQLPPYMVPGQILEIEDIPRNPNGKIDYRRLPEAGEKKKKVYILPGNNVEKRLHEIWSAIFPVKTIGITDNFFELGGNSLNLMSLISKIHREFDVRISLGEIFNNSTIRDQAKIIAETGKEKYVSIEPLEKKEYYNVSYAQRRVWLLSQLKEASLAFNMPFSCVLVGELNREAFNNAFLALTARHESLRTVFIPLNSDVYQKILPPDKMDLKLNYIDLRDYEGEEKDAKMRNISTSESNILFDLSTGPLLRVILTQLEEEKYVFILMQHHIVSDFISIIALVSELFGLYSAFARAEQNPLPPLRIHYKDYAVWQYHQLTGEYLKKHQDYWLQCFKKEISPLELPLDEKRPEFQTYRGDTVGFLVDETLTRQLKSLSEQQEATLFMTLLAGVTVLLYHYSPREDMVIGVPISGRQHAELENQIGFFLNTLALPISFDAEAPFTALLNRVKQAAVDAFEHQAYPFDKLVEDLGGKRDMSRHPLFDVAMDMQNYTRLKSFTVPQQDKLKVYPYDTGIKTSKFDLAFYVRERENTIYIDLEYNTDIFAAETIRRMVERFKKILDSIVMDSNIIITDFQLEDELEMPTIVPLQKRAVIE